MNRPKCNFWSVHGIMNTSGLLQSKLTLQETGCVHVFHDSMNRPKCNFWSVYGIMNTSGLLQSKLTLQETGCVHVFYDSMNRPKIEFITNIYIYYKHLI